jgi:hypothetical protein
VEAVRHRTDAAGPSVPATGTLDVRHGATFRSPDRRDENATRRDEAAEIRDRVAARRDETASQRDRDVARDALGASDRETPRGRAADR